MINKLYPRLCWLIILMVFFTLLSTSKVQSASDPIGVLEAVSPDAVSGWAYDADSGANPIYVRIYIDDSYNGQVLTDGYRPGIREVFPWVQGDYHGFTYTLPSLTPGTHKVQAYAIDYPSERSILLPCDPPCTTYITISEEPSASDPIGSVDLVTLGGIMGWAYDADAGADPTDVRIYVDDAYVAQVRADHHFPELPNVMPEIQGEYHRFEYQFSGLGQGAHHVKVYAVDYPSGRECPLPCFQTCEVTVDEGMVYLENELVRVGVNLDWGGTISEISYEGRNLVNNLDNGRQVQVVLADGSYSYDPLNMGDLGYHPNQGGDEYGRGSPVISYNVSEGQIYIKTQPLQWNPDDKGGGSTISVRSDVYVEQWVTIEDKIVKVDYKVSHFGNDYPTDSRLPPKLLS
jgi:hypothetical protein